MDSSFTGRKVPRPTCSVTFTYDTETLYEKLDELGKMPLPPYITKQLEDQSQYQTVYAKELGSAAAPTAGLHFTPQLMDTIRAMGVNIAEVTLHVGLGTFLFDKAVRHVGSSFID